jgi:hypothetical protein
MRSLLCATLLLATIASSADAKKYIPPPMPPGYDNPGPRPEHLLEQITASLRMTLTDPYSVKGFSLCEPYVVQATEPMYSNLEWTHAQWVVLFALNSKNGFGGYTGTQLGIADIVDGKVTKASLMGGLDDGTRERIASCRHVPDAEIEKLFQAG